MNAVEKANTKLSQEKRLFGFIVVQPASGDDEYKGALEFTYKELSHRVFFKAKGFTKDKRRHRLTIAQDEMMNRITGEAALLIRPNEHLTRFNLHPVNQDDKKKCVWSPGMRKLFGVYYRIIISRLVIYKLAAQADKRRDVAMQGFRKSDAWVIERRVCGIPYFRMIEQLNSVSFV